jgi:hypothetical protein
VQHGARVALLSRGTDLIYGDFVFEGIFPTSEVASGKGFSLSTYNVRSWSTRVHFEVTQGKKGLLRLEIIL